jgi:hypothetical protein
MWWERDCVPSQIVPRGNRYLGTPTNPNRNRGWLWEFNRTFVARPDRMNSKKWTSRAIRTEDQRSQGQPYGSKSVAIVVFQLKRLLKQPHHREDPVTLSLILSHSAAVLSINIHESCLIHIRRGLTVGRWDHYASHLLFYLLFDLQIFNFPPSHSFRGRDL